MCARVRVRVLRCQMGQTDSHVIDGLRDIKAEPSPASTEPRDTVARRGWGDRHLWLVIALAACVVIPRAAMICRAHNEGVDDDYHLRRGLLFWSGLDVDLRLNDPTFGAAVTALPMWLLGCDSRDPIDARNVPPRELVPFGPRAGMESAQLSPVLRDKARASRRHVLYGQRLSPDALLMTVGVWKAALYVPFVAIAFAWCRSLYGTPSGWMAATLLVFEPNFAAQVHTAGLDVLAVEMIVITCYAAWRFARGRLTWWLVAMAAAGAVAMSVKHTALILPGALTVYLLIEAWTRGRPMLNVNAWRMRVRWAALAAVVWAGALWAMTAFDVSIPAEVGGDYWHPPKDAAGWRHTLAHVVEVQLTRHLPAGQYIGSVFSGLKHNAVGHWAYLLGEQRLRGWWYYFPVVASFKVPVGVLTLLGLGVFSLKYVRPRAGELALVVPLLAWGALLFVTNINIGFRHALPAYTFALLLATRTALPASPRWLRTAAWVGVAAAALHGLSYHPNYHAYFNLPRQRPYLDVNDSNVDWGQAIKPIARWLDEKHESIGDRPVHLRTFGDDNGVIAAWHLGHRVSRLEIESPRPRTGLLIISPIHVVGLYDAAQPYAALASAEPHDVIADTMLVYDMDKLVAGGFAWPEPVTGRLPFTDLR